MSHTKFLIESDIHVHRRLQQLGFDRVVAQDVNGQRFHQTARGTNEPGDPMVATCNRWGERANEVSGRLVPGGQDP